MAIDSERNAPCSGISGNPWERFRLLLREANRIPAGCPGGYEVNLVVHLCRKYNTPQMYEGRPRGQSRDWTKATCVAGGNATYLSVVRLFLLVSLLIFAVCEGSRAFASLVPLASWGRWRLHYLVLLEDRLSVLWQDFQLPCNFRRSVGAARLALSRTCCCQRRHLRGRLACRHGR